MQEWWNNHGQWITVISIALSLAGTAFGIAVIVNMPSDHYLSKQAPFLGFFKNALGAAMLVLGLVMAIPLIPGPGMVLLLIGLSLMNFPGKKNLELRLLRLPGALATVNSMRGRFKRPPFELPEH